METTNFVVPDSLQVFVEERMKAGGYDNLSEYLRELIRLDQRQQAYSLLEAELLKGMASGPATEMKASDWEALREGVRQRAGAGAK